jgi:hypothetical protein
LVTSSRQNGSSRPGKKLLDQRLNSRGFWFRINDLRNINYAIAVTKGPTSRIFSQFIAISHLDNKAAIRYLNPARLNDNENCRWVSDPTTYWDSTGYSAQP